CDDADAISAHKTIYDFSVKGADGKPVSLSKYKGQVVIVVNVASQCGFTDNHYTELKELQDKYYSDGLRVAAFPCNQFGSQEPGSEAEIIKFVRKQYDYEPDLYAKVNVNGEDADQFWEFLKKEQGGTIIDAIKWNFTKFLIDRKGYVIKRFAPTTSPRYMTADIERLGLVVMVVNVASQCGFTKTNYTEFKVLLDTYHSKGLRIAAFPCNQFKAQEPACEIEIVKNVKEKYGCEPDIYGKINVNGEDADPFWVFLKKEQGGFLTDAIKWNFTKFLVNRRGEVVKR
ncbi:unnamed protein product, partial [Nippostrongylus brasiliensis]|uniref:Glutathione peroxidase n=1 Tax=Nippostrongylus brasiliensis TaxID=27835 RepID=A0A0N4Y7P3_NIPBR